MSDFRNIIKKELGHLFHQDEQEEEDEYEEQNRFEIIPPKLTHYNQEQARHSFDRVEMPLLKVVNKVQGLKTEKPIQKQRAQNKRKEPPVTEYSDNLKNEGQFYESSNATSGSNNFLSTSNSLMQLCSQVKQLAEQKYEIIKDTLDTIITKVKALSKTLELKMSSLNIKCDEEKKIQLAIKDVESFSSNNIAQPFEMKNFVCEYQMKLESIQSIKLISKSFSKKRVKGPIAFNRKELFQYRRLDFQIKSFDLTDPLEFKPTHLIAHQGPYIVVYDDALKYAFVFYICGETYKMCHAQQRETMPPLQVWDPKNLSWVSRSILG